MRYHGHKGSACESSSANLSRSGIRKKQKKSCIRGPQIHTNHVDVGEPIPLGREEHAQMRRSNGQESKEDQQHLHVSFLLRSKRRNCASVRLVSESGKKDSRPLSLSPLVYKQGLLPSAFFWGFLALSGQRDLALLL